jgi:hypothetical protein
MKSRPAAGYLKKVLAVEESNLTRFIAGFRRIELLPPRNESQLKRRWTGMSSSRTSFGISSANWSRAILRYEINPQRQPQLPDGGDR